MNRDQGSNLEGGGSCDFNAILSALGNYSQIKYGILVLTLTLCLVDLKDILEIFLT